ncbi:MAG: LptF/LptG family permease [Planctomycetota bacterium]|nr:LptF/LptG family permease [Planctomycetota bacterium]
MTILDKYVLRTFLPALLAAAAMLIFMFVLVDFLQRADKFMKLASDEVWGAAAEYYLYRVPGIFVKMAPMIALAAAMLTVVRFLRTHEHTAVAAAGISLQRLLLPVFLCLGLLMAFSMLAEEFIIPACGRRMVSSETRLERDKEYGAHQVADGLGNAFRMEGFDARANRMREVMVNIMDKENALIGEIYAQSAHWVPGLSYGEEIPVSTNVLGEFGKWVLSNGWYQGYEGVRRAGPKRDFGPDGWYVVSDLAPQIVFVEESLSMCATFAQLRELVRKNPLQYHLRVKMHNRLAYPLGIIIVPAIGMSLLLMKQRFNYLSTVALTIFTASGYFAVHLLLLNMGNVGQLNHVVAVWAPVLIFGAGAIFLVDMIKT